MEEDYSCLDPARHQEKVALPVAKPKTYTLPLSQEDYKEIIEIWNPKTQE